MAQAQQPEKRTVWDQRTDDVGNVGDSETMKIFGQMTGTGLISTENKSKGNFNKK